VAGSQPDGSATLIGCAAGRLPGCWVAGSKMLLEPAQSPGLPRNPVFAAVVLRMIRKVDRLRRPSGSRPRRGWKAGLMIRRGVVVGATTLWVR